MTPDERKAMDAVATRRVVAREWVDLKPGEIAPPPFRPLPEGKRWETDAEFRTRLQAIHGGE